MFLQATACLYYLFQDDSSIPFYAFSSFFSIYSTILSDPQPGPFRIKSRVVHQVLSEGISDLGYVGLLSASFIDLKTGTEHTESELVLLPRGKKFGLGTSVSDASGEALEGNPGDDGAGTLLQSVIEMSNVQVVEEMVNMIVAQRAYESDAKAITTSDSMLEIANGLKR